MDDCRRKFADLGTSGSTDGEAAVKEALTRKPDVIVLVTAKGINLDASLPKAIEKLNKGNTVRIHTVDLARGDGKTVLSAIADASKGSYTAVAPSDLK